MGNRLLPALLVALLLIFLQVRSGAGTSYVIVVAAMAAFAYVVIASGRMLLVAAGVHDSDPSGTYVMGLIATCLGVYALTVMFALTAGAAFGIVAAIVIGLEIAFARRYRGLPVDWRALIGFALCVAFTAAWCSGPAGAYDVLRAQGVLPVWSDYFVHGSIISQFGDVRAAGHQSIFLADFPSSFYHFGSYAAAAALAGMLDQPGLPLATSVWLPLGFLAMTAGAYALGERLAGAAGGLAALAAVAILPDASNYGLRNGVMSFHWSVLAHPGATYGLGAAFLSFTFLDRWTNTQSPVALVASAVLAASVFLFRVHIFLLYFPAWIATTVYCRTREGRSRRLVALLAVATLGAAAFVATLALPHLAQTDLIGRWRFGEPALGKFLTDLHSFQEPTAYTGIYADLTRDGSPIIAFGVGILLTVCAALGVFLVLLPGTAAVAGHRGAVKPVDAFPAYVAYCWLVLLLFAPVTRANAATDLIERPIVLLYACSAIWTMCFLLRCLALRTSQQADRVWRIALAGSLVALPATLIGAEGMARPKFEWGGPHVSHRVEPGLVEAAAYLRSHATVGDIFATARLSASFVSFDLPVKLCSLSGMPTYLSRPGLEMMKERPRERVAAARLAALEEVEKQKNHGNAMQLLKRMRVQWYVVAGEKGPLWDPRRKRAAFSAGTVAVYATRKEASGTALHDDVGVRNSDQVVAHDAAHLLELGSGKRLVGRWLAHMAATIE